MQKQVDTAALVQYTEENEAAMMWLRSKGLTFREIKYFKWKWIDLDNEMVVVTRFTETKSGKIKEKKIKFSYYDSPLVEITCRPHGINIFVFYKKPQKTEYGFPSCETYSELEVEDICSHVKVSQNRKMLLTKNVIFGKIRVSKVS